MCTCFYLNINLRLSGINAQSIIIGLHMAVAYLVFLRNYQKKKKRNYQTIFQRGYIIVHSHQQGMNTPFLCSIWWCQYFVFHRLRYVVISHLALICIFPVVHNTEHLFLCLSVMLYILFNEISLYVFCLFFFPFSIDCLILFNVVLRIFYIL